MSRLLEATADALSMLHGCEVVATGIVLDSGRPWITLEADDGRQVTVTLAAETPGLPLFASLRFLWLDADSEPTTSYEWGCD